MGDSDTGASTDANNRVTRNRGSGTALANQAPAPASRKRTSGAAGSELAGPTAKRNAAAAAAPAAIILVAGKGKSKSAGGAQPASGPGPGGQSSQPQQQDLATLSVGNAAAAAFIPGSSSGLIGMTPQTAIVRNRALSASSGGSSSGNQFGVAHLYLLRQLQSSPALCNRQRRLYQISSASCRM